MTVCYFGIYNPDYSRNRIMIKGLRAHGIEIIECNSRAKGLKKYFQLWWKHRKIRKKYDVMVVGFPGQQAALFARWLVGNAKKKKKKPKIVFDAFSSLYLSLVEDRKEVRPCSLRAIGNYILDWLSVRTADVVLLDTDEHIKYFVRTFRISKKKFLRVPVGSDMEDLIIEQARQTQEHKICSAQNSSRPIVGRGSDSCVQKFHVPSSAPFEKRKKDSFLIHFHGTIIPLQGIPIIEEAARLLAAHPYIRFRLVGGREEYAAKKNAEGHGNIEYLPHVSYSELARLMRDADVVLGIFGSTKKARFVVPNKVYEGLALAKPVLTLNTPALREFFTSHDLCIIQDAKPEILAHAIVELATHPEIREAFARKGYEVYQRRFSPEKVVEPLLSVFGVSKSG